MVGVSYETLWSWLGAKKRNKQKPVATRLCSRSPARPTKEQFRLKMGDPEEQNDNDAVRIEKELLLSRITHLHLEGKGITHIEDFSCCQDARVIFLQHNHLTRLSNLRPLHLLQELYLQDNHITRLECLRELHSLRRLFISGNRIGVVEGLPQQLQELHIQNQRLPPGDALVLDPHALTYVQSAMQVLDISGNRITEIGAIGLLTNLQCFRAVDNDLDSLSHLTAVLSRLNNLQAIYLSGNPVTAHRRYHISVVLASPPTLEILDGRDITSQSRDFIVQAECHRLSLRKRSKQKGSVPRGNNNVITMETHLLFTSSTQNEPSGPPATGPRFVLGALRRPEFDLILNRAQRLSINSYLATTAEEDLQESKTAKSSNYQDGEDDEEEPSKDHTEGGNDISDSITLPKDVSGNTENTQWHNNSASAIYPLEKSVWFAAEDEPPMEEVPRFIPRPYWRNKPPASKPKSSLKS